MTDPEPIPPKPRRKHRWLIGCAIVVVVLLGACLITATIAGRLWSSVPDHWEAHERFVAERDATELDRLATPLQDRVLTEVSAPGSEPRTIVLGLDEANAWLDQKLGDWLANQSASLPSEMSEPMLTTADGRIVLACRFAAEGTEQIVSMFFNVAIEDDGQARLLIDTIQFGRLPVPSSALKALIEGQVDNEATGVLFGEHTIDPVMQFDGSRQVRLLGIEIHDDRLELEVVNEPR